VTTSCAGSAKPPGHCPIATSDGIVARRLSGILRSMLVAITTPPTNDRGPQYMEQALAAIHQANHRRLAVSLEFARHAESSVLSLRFPSTLRAIVEGQVFAQYPDCSIERVRHEDGKLSSDHRYWSVALRASPDVFPLRRYQQFEDSLNRVTSDPVSAILTTMGRTNHDQIRGRVEIILRPARLRLRSRARKTLERLATPFFRSHHRLAHAYAILAMSRWLPIRLAGWLLGRCGRRAEAHFEQLSTSSARLHDREADLQAASDKLGKLLFEVQIRLIVTAPATDELLARSKLSEIAGAFGQFSLPRLASFHLSRVRRSKSRPRRLRSRAFLLSTEELATIWHPPTSSVRAQSMAIVESREMEPPVALPTIGSHQALAVLGQTQFRGSRKQFGLLPDDRRRHLAILGKTGMGKSTLLRSLIASDIQAGRGVAVIDPHGDLADAVLLAIPKSRTNDVVLFDAGDTAFPLSFNMLACPNAEQRPLVASGIVSAFKKLYGESWGPRLEHILRNALLALLEVPGTSLLSLVRLLSEAKYREQLVGRVTDPVVRGFWQREFALMHTKLQSEAIAPIQNKVGHFVSSPLLRNIVGQSRTTFDLRSLMDDGKVLIVNLSKGRIGDDSSMLLGSLLVTSIQIATMSRSNVPESDRPDFYLYVDEFQNFATDSFATILSEARKYRLNLTIANQYLAQMDEATADAVFGNVGSLLCFQVGARDAEILVEQFGSDLLPQDLMRLPRYQAYVRLLVNGMPSRPFSMRTLPPDLREDQHRSETIRRYSRQRYARPRAQVENEIRAAFGPA